MVLLGLDYKRCLLDTDIKGGELEPEADCGVTFNREETVAKCHQRCLSHSQCLSYAYITEKFSYAPCRNMCFLKAVPIEGNMTPKDGVVSGPRLCIEEF